MRNAVAAAFAATLLAGAVLGRAVAADDASVGYETIRPSLVKVWAFDRSGRPTQSGTGIVVASGNGRSHILTATHVIAGAAAIRIDVSRDEHDLPAHVERTGPRDLTLLEVDRGGLRAARFAPRTHAVVAGNEVAVAGYVKNDELIGVVGQEPRVLFPGTIAARPENGVYLELENVHIEEGLSGGPVFDPGTGDVLGIVTSRTSDRRGGFADSGALVVLPFLGRADVAAAPAPAAAKRSRMAAPPPAAAQPLAEPPRFVAAAERALPLPTVPPVAAVAAALPPAPRPADGGIASWQSAYTARKHFAYTTREGCRIAVTVSVTSLQFIVAHDALVQPRKRGALLGVTIRRQAGQSDACTDVAGSDPVDTAYDPTAMSYDGHHVTMRFTSRADADDTMDVPSDVSLDADLSGDAATATLQFFDADWTGAIDVPLDRTPLAAVSSTW